MSMGQWWKDDYQGKIEQPGEKPAPVPLRLPQIPLKVTRV
jgi:hypothetical protein